MTEKCVGVYKLKGKTVDAKLSPVEPTVDKDKSRVSCFWSYDGENCVAADNSSSPIDAVKTKCKQLP